MKLRPATIVGIICIIYFLLIGDYDSFFIFSIIMCFQELILTIAESRTSTLISKEEQALIEIKESIEEVEKIIMSIDHINQDEFSSIFSNLQDIKVTCSRKTHEKKEYAPDFNVCLDKVLDLIEYMKKMKPKWIKE